MERQNSKMDAPLQLLSRLLNVLTHFHLPVIPFEGARHFGFLLFVLFFHIWLFLTASVPMQRLRFQSFPSIELFISFVAHFMKGGDGNFQWLLPQVESACKAILFLYFDWFFCTFEAYLVIFFCKWGVCFLIHGLLGKGERHWQILPQLLIAVLMMGCFVWVKRCFLIQIISIHFL